jgi:CRISPR-associated protein Csy2
MNGLPQSEALLVLPRLRVQNANAISSPMTHGFPSITAFLGLMWALERKLSKQHAVEFDSVGVICHHHAEQVEGRYTKTFCLTRNPVGKDGKTAAIVEEGRIHLDITLVFGVSTDLVDADDEQRAAFARVAADTLTRMRIAGGTLLPSAQPWRRPALEVIPQDAEDAVRFVRKLRARLLPGFALVSRDDLLQQRLAQMRNLNPDASSLDAWLDLSRINWKPVQPPAEEPNKPAKVEWEHDRHHGWVVPIPVGYGALSDVHSPGSVANARDDKTPFRFTESLYSIGQWISPHRLDTLRQLLWYNHSDPDNGLYRACNDYVQQQTANTY